MKSTPVGTLTTLLACATSFATAGNWPGWRGPEGTGISTEKNLPLKWSTNENVRWRVNLPGPGNSSPAVWGNRIFVAQAVPGENRRTLMCFDRVSGKQLWQSGVTYTNREPTQRSNPYCSATPVTDGERVIASFGSAGLFCYDLNGKELWHRDFGKMNHVFGNGASPILAGDLCILNFGPDEKARLIAVNKRTGETTWEVNPPAVDPSERQQTRGGGQGGQGGRGGGGFGIGSGIAPQVFAQADKDSNKKVSGEEFTALADLWYEKFDPEKTGRTSREQLGERFYEAIPPQDDSGSRQQSGGRRVSRTTAPAFLAATDIDKDGSLTRTELKTTLGKWFTDWDTQKTGSLSEEQIRDGLNAALVRQDSTAGRPDGDRQGGGGRTADRGAGGQRAGGFGGGGGGTGGSWSTPIVTKVNGREELIMAFPNRLAAYDPRTGKQLWLSKGLGGTIYTTPVWGEDTLFATTSGPGGGAAIALKPGGSGDITESHRRWRLERAKSAIGSGVIHQGHLYTISQDGIAECIDLNTGKAVWEERLRGPGSRSSSWSSMLLADEKIYVPNQAGDVFVIRAAPKFEILATNSVGEPTNASLAASDGDLFFRTDKSLWCFTGSPR